MHSLLLTSSNLIIAFNPLHATLNVILLYVTFLITDYAYLPR